jgi:hypothetical protein
MRSIGGRPLRATADLSRRGGLLAVERPGHRQPCTSQRHMA